MLKSEDIDVVYIATESGYHPEIAIYCMNNGKHVICENQWHFQQKMQMI